MHEDLLPGTLPVTDAPDIVTTTKSHPMLGPVACGTDTISSSCDTARELLAKHACSSYCVVIFDRAMPTVFDAVDAKISPRLYSDDVASLKILAACVSNENAALEKTNSVNRCTRATTSVHESPSS